MSIEEKINLVRKNFLNDIDSFPQEKKAIEDLKSKYLGRKGLVSELFAFLGEAIDEERPALGKRLNLFKDEVLEKFELETLKVHKENTTFDNDEPDFSLPGREIRLGSLHILDQTLSEIKEIFKSIGFHLAYGPEIDDEYHNFSALNIPEHHPARDMQDTFFVDKKTVLRTHTSNVQIHLMEKNDPPLRYIVPGRVYRNEAIGYKSYCLFHQVEGIYINKKVSLAELKGCLEYFVKQMFGLKIKTRFRPSFFPFTEPSAEVDIWDNKRKQWMEILGCGMVDPEVLNNVGYDTKKWNGYAFGMGVERISMLKYGIDDIRHFYSGDLRFSEQFI